MMMTSRWWRGLALVAATFLTGPARPAAQVPLPAPAAPQAPAGTLELLLDQGRRLFDAFQYDQALPLFDRLILALSPGGQASRPDLLTQVLELRARSRFALGDTQGAEQDFSALLALNPGYKLAAGVSPRVVASFDSVRKLVVGQVLMSLTPAGEVQIDGRTVALGPDQAPVDLAAGDHQAAATRQGYAPLQQRFSVAPGESTTLALVMERVSATLTLSSIPDGVEVWLDGTSRGTTARGAAAPGPSAPLVIGDLPTGPHRLQLRRACFQDVERTITVARPEDLQLDALRLTPAVASVRVQASEAGAAVFLDGVAKGSAPAEISDLCAGSHVIEVRGAGGRYVDRREWKTGDSVALNAVLEPAFAIVGAQAAAADLRDEAERALAAATNALVYAPAAADLERALAGENVPANWLDPLAPGGSRTSKDVVRDLSRRLSAKLATQGVAAVAAGTDRSELSVAILAAGSAEPDLLTFRPADPASRARAVERLSAPLPPVVRPSMGTSVVDVDGVPGAVVVRVGGAGGAAGLAVGDVIVGAGGAPVATVRDLRGRIAALRPGALDLPLDVRAPDGTARTVTGAIALVPDTLPLRDSRLPYNRAIVDLQQLVRSSSNALEKAAARVNLAIAQLRVGNVAEAETELRAADLPAGPGVSAGTVAYLLGLSLEAAGRTADARAAFTKAADATDARLSADGPLVGPLARQKLGR
ncbi:MAG: PEGA domain-containing protein [Acidobacteria bacterium]|nr:PEGA domain-containing protein [Acidobacteriota bacterium]